MKVLGLKALEGPNVFHSNPVLLLTIDLERWADVGSHQIKGFKQSLLEILPGLEEHTCSPGYRGGFCERLDRGTYMAHIIEHVALELGRLAGIENFFGKTKYAGRPGIYEVVVRYQNEAGMRVCLQSAVDLVRSILENRNFDLKSCMEKTRQAIQATKLGPTGEALFSEARRRGIPVRRLGEGSLLEMGFGKYRHRVQTAVTDRTNLIAVDMVQDKQFTKTLLEDWGFSVPKGGVVSTAEELMQMAAQMPRPLAVKPLDGHHGDGVCLNVESDEDLLKAFQAAREFSTKVIVEEMCQGRDYRILIIDGKFTAAAERMQPQVAGDGKKTVQQLVDELNQDPRRGMGHESVMTQIVMDEIALDCLKKQNLGLSSVPVAGQTVILRGNANLSSGGTARDATAEVHPEVRQLCERVARLVDLDICGIDAIAQNLATPPGDHFKIIEVNAGPGLRMHLSPSVGEARNVAADILNTIYPPGAQSRIPIVAVTGTNGKTTVARLIHKILSSNATVGMTSSDGILIGSSQVMEGDFTGPQATQIVLSDPKVEAAVLEVARGGIRRRGLGYDWSDVGVITNIREDHIGQDGIENVEDLIWIKSLVAERVKENGTVVLNADDANALSVMSAPQMQRIYRQYLLYSNHPQNPALKKHLLAGGDGAWAEAGWIYIQIQKKVHRLVSVHNLSFALEGKAMFQVSNALAAVGASAALGATPDQIVMGLMSFQPNADNRGRLNLYRVNNGHVVMDYGHNPDAIAAMGEFLSQWPEHRKVAVLGLPGDRTDQLLQESSRPLLKYFDQVILRDDSDLRGRQPGEVPKLLCAAITARNPKFPCILKNNEQEAVEHALNEIKSGDIVVLFYESLNMIQPVLRQYDPVPVTTIPSFETEKIPSSDEYQISTSAYQVMG